MLIKCMGIKKTNWSKHYDYFSSKGKNKMYSWNLSVDPYDKNAVIDEYKYNYSFLKHNLKAKNIYLHEVVSLANNNLSEKEQEEALYKLVDKYLSLRTNGNLVLGAIHKDTDNMHMHLKISSNPYMETKPTRFSKKRFKAIQKEIELYKNKLYPELATNHYQDKYKKKHKQKIKEQHINHKRKKLTKKQKVLNLFKQTLNSATTKKDLFLSLKNKGLKVYRKGKYFGIVDTNNSNRKYRLRTLEENLDEKFIQRIKSMEKHQKLQYQAQQKAKSQYKGRNYGR